MTLLDAPRRLLLQLIAENPDRDMKGLSEYLGKNPAYIQQYIQKGSPKELREPEREKLGIALGVDADLFRPEADPRRKTYQGASLKTERRQLPAAAGPEVVPDRRAKTVSIPEYDVSPQAGGGSFATSMASEDSQTPVEQWALPRRLVDAFVDDTAALAIIRVMGDSMEPEYFAGDRVMVDTRHTIPTPPGIYVLHDGIGMVLKRVEVVFGSSDPVMLRISSVNQAYSTYERALDEVHINGRVVAKWVWK